MVNVFVVDNDHIVRAGLVLLLQTVEEFSVVGEADCGESAIEQIDLVRSADVVLMDIKMGDLDGIDTLLELRRRKCDVPVLMLTGLPQFGLITRAMRAGASGYVEKNNRTADLFTAVRAVASKGQYLDDATRDKLVAHALGRAEHEPTEKVTSREQEVLRLLVGGATTKAIAKALYIEESTAETHRRNLLHKFECKNTAELVRFVTKYGLDE